MAKKYRSEAYAAIHETMEALHEVGAIDKQTMRECDKTCLTPALPMSPERIRALREREHLSQPVFALYLNVSKNLVSDWERGVKKPGGPALRLLTVVEKNGIQAIARPSGQILESPREIRGATDAVATYRTSVFR